MTATTLLTPVMEAIGLEPTTTSHDDALAILGAIPEDDTDLLRASARRAAVTLLANPGRPPAEVHATTDPLPTPPPWARQRDPTVFGPFRW